MFAQQSFWISRFVLVVAAHIGSSSLLPAQSDDSSDQQVLIPAANDSEAAKITVLTRAIQTDPRNAGLYRQRGYSYELQFDFDDALSDLNEAVRLDSQNPDGYRIRGFAHLQKGEIDDAVSDYSQTIKLRPDATIAYARRSQAYELKGDWDQAADDLDQATRLLQQKPQSVLVYLVTAGDWREMKSYDRVRATLDQAVKAGLTDPRVFRQLAWLLATCAQADLRDGKQAVQDATTACDLSHWNMPATIDTLAAACAEEGDFDSAIKWENRFLQTPALQAKILKGAQNRLSLYEAHQPYHADK